MERIGALLSCCLCLLPLVASHFVPPDVILQAGYPAGFRAFIPDFSGCQQFAFHGKINSPFDQVNELGSIYQEVLQPQDGYWVILDFKLVLNVGDVVHFWTNVVKDGVDYPKHNQTWKVPDSKNAVNLSSPIKPPKQQAEEPDVPLTTPTVILIEEETTLPMDTQPPTIDNSSPSLEPTTISTQVLTSTTAKVSTSSPIVSETPSSAKATESSPETSTLINTTTKKLQSEKRETQSPKTKTTELPTVSEELEELTTPFLRERPIASDFPIEPPPYPYPYPRPLKPMMPSSGPGFEICSNPWFFEERPGETRTQKLERQVAKLQCQLGLFQRGYNQLSNTVETELTDLKKLIYGMVSRMASLESALRSSPFG